MALAGILSFSDKIIDKKLAEEIRGCLKMTKVGAIIAREMEESEERGKRAGRAEGMQKKLHEQIRKKMLKRKSLEQIIEELEEEPETICPLYEQIQEELAIK